MTTGSDGSFNITSAYPCPTGAYVYLTATGGNPGLAAANPNLAAMTALGSCSALMTSNSFIQVNEVTTVAAVAALAPYMTSYSAVGTSDTAGLISAFTLASQLVNTASGTAPGTNVPSGATVPVSLINTLADILSYCVNSTGGTAGDGSACGQFLALATAGSSALPTNTIAALLNIAYNPASNTTALFNLLPSNAPFQSTLSAAPSSFAIGLVWASNAGSLQLSPSSISFPVTSVGTTSASQSVTVLNSSGSAIGISGINMAGVNAGDFSLLQNCPASLANNSFCSVLVSVTPTAVGARYGDLVIESSSTQSPQVVPLSVANPVPTITSLNPASTTAGATTPTTILVIGSNFLPSTQAQIGGSTRPTTYFSSTQLAFQLSVTDQATAGRYSVTMVNPPAGGGASAAATLTISAPTPAPIISSVSPTSFVATATASYIYVFGTNLTSGTSIQWNGTTLSTVYYYSAYYGYYLGATVPASYLSSAGTASITAINPLASPTTSNTLTVSITNPPAPTLTSISPSSVPINTATALTIYGTNFTANATATLNGLNLPVTYVSSTTLTATIPASSITLPGTQAITVTVPSPGGGTTAPLYLTAYIGIPNNSMIYNPVSGLFYLSVPSAAGAPYGNSVVSVDPATGALGTPILVGSEPNKMAISSDGQYMWVGLDGSSSVRQVNLTTGVAGLQFGLGGNTGIYATPGTALALAVLPGAPNSVVVSSSSSYGVATFAIYDSGVTRGTGVTGYSPYSILINGTTSEIYTSTGATYRTYTYTSNALTLKATGTANLNYSNSSTDEMTIAGSALYTDYGQVDDPESGSLRGTFYSTGTTVASGSIAVDTTLGTAYILDQAANYGSTQIQAFNLANYTTTSATPVAVTAPTSSLVTLTNSGPRLTRWGTNGLAFRGTGGIVSLRLNLVKDLSSVYADLGVSLAVTGGTTTGSVDTYTATVTNNGPSGATNVTLAEFAPSTGILQTIVPSAGTCSTASGTCDLGSIANGASVTVTMTVLQTTAGSATMTVQVAGSETDSTTSNNKASQTVVVTGNAYNGVPTISSITPNAILSGSSDTIITVTGTGFLSGSKVQFNGTALSTSYTSGTTLTATIPSASLTSLGWGAVTVSTPAPGGGVSTATPLSIYSVMTVGVNHILYEPYTRKIYASVSSGSSTVTGNSIAAITPETQTVGTPVYVGSQPGKMAISDDGNILYTLLQGANSIARFNLQTQTTEFTVSPSITNYGGGTTGFRDVAVQTGSENTIAVDFGYTSGMGLIDFNPTAKTGTLRGASTGIYTGTSLHFYNASTLYLFNSDTWNTLDQYSVGTSGFGSTHASSTLNSFGTFQLVGSTGFADNGGVANVTTTPATQLGVYQPIMQYGAARKVAPDVSLGSVFFLANTSATSNYYSSPDGIVVYNQASYLPTLKLPLNMSTTEGNTSFTGVDLIRWGQDGLAALTSGGHIYLLRGGAVVPQELTTNSAATLTSGSASSIAHGTGNTILTFTGSNFLPGVGIFWNGGYRTTTIVDATHVTAAISASDLASPGSASVTAVNAGASASGALTITIN